MSGSVTFAGGFSGAVTLPSGSDAWVQSGGSGQTSGTAQYGYSYSGGGSGLASDGTTWNIPTESGSGNGTNGYNGTPLTVSFNSTYGEWSVNESAGSSPTGSYTQQDAYTYQSARSEPYYDGYVVGTENYTTSINDNATVVNDTTQERMTKEVYRHQLQRRRHGKFDRQRRRQQRSGRLVERRGERYMVRQRRAWR